MGGKSSSSNTTKNYVDSSTRQNFTNQSGAGLAVDGSMNRISVLDGGAIDGAFKFGSDVLDFARDTSDGSFYFAGDTVDGAYDLSRSVVDAQRESNRDSLDFAVDAINSVGRYNDSALEFADESSARAFEFGGDSVDGAFSLSRAVIDSQREASRNALDRSVQLAQGAISDSANNNARAFQFAQGVANPGQITADQMKYAALAVTVIAAALIFKGRK